LEDLGKTLKKMRKEKGFTQKGTLTELKMCFPFMMKRVGWMMINSPEKPVQITTL